MRKLLLCVILLLFLCSIGYCQDQPLTLTIKSDKEVYEEGEEIKLEATIKNNSDKEMIVFWNDERPAQASGGGGTSLVVMHTPSQAYAIYIKPKEAIKKIISPGTSGESGPTFSLQYSYRVMALDFKHKPNQEIFKGTLTSNTITIEVKEKKPNQPMTFIMDLKFNYEEGKKHWWTFKVDQNELNSLDDLKKFLKTIPSGSILKWAPGCDRIGDEPLINSKSEMEEFKKFCNDNGITLVIIPGG